MIITLSFIGFTLDVLGKLLIAWVTLRLHVKHFKTHHVNKKDIKIDAWMSSIGIAMIAVGYFMRVPFEMSIPPQF